VLTPFMLYVASLAPPERLAPHRDGIARALAHADDPVDEYPSYTRALRVLALVRHKPSGWEKRVERLTRELCDSQLVESNGWSPDDPEYGGWDYGGVPPKKPHCQRPDISTTAFAVEALRAAGAPESAAARRFASTCRNADGGAFFTPSARWVVPQNKAGPADGGWRSYGTASADAAFVLSESQWLDKHFTALRTPGFPESAERWDEALQYYWLFAAARAGRRDPAIRARLAALQRADGSWANAHSLMKEDDPLLATGLALAAWYLGAPR